MKMSKHAEIMFKSDFSLRIDLFWFGGNTTLVNKSLVDQNNCKLSYGYCCRKTRFVREAHSFVQKLHLLKKKLTEIYREWAIH